MSENTSFEQWLNDLRTTPDYKATGLALDFVVACERKREELGLSYADVARKLNVSRARVNQLFRGECNMTLVTMQALADALELRLSVKALDIRLESQNIHPFRAANWRRNGDYFGEISESRQESNCGSAA